MTQTHMRMHAAVLRQPGCAGADLSCVPREPGSERPFACAQSSWARVPGNQTPCMRTRACKAGGIWIPNVPHTDPLSYQTLSYEELKTVIKAEQYGTMIFIILFFLSKIIFCTSVLSLPFSNYILPPSTCKLHLNNLANLLRYIS